MNKSEVDYYIELQKEMFDLLKDITNMQLTAAKNAKMSKNVTDYQTYKLKIDLYLKGLSNAVQTINTILVNIKRTSDVDATITELKKTLKELKEME